MQKKTSIKLITFIISFLWISLGTVIQIMGYPAYNYLGFDYNSFVYNFLWWITFPFNIILFALLYSDELSNIYVIVILLQSVKVLIYWWIIYKTWLKFYRKNNKVMTNEQQIMQKNQKETD